MKKARVVAPSPTPIPVQPAALATVRGGALNPYLILTGQKQGTIKG